MLTLSIYPSICKWQTILNFNLIFTIFINNIQNFDINFTSRSLTMTSNILLCLSHMSNNSFTIPTIVGFVWIDTNLATKMAYVPSHFENYVIKSIKILSKGLDRIRKALYNPIFFCVPTWCFGISHKCGHNALHLLSFWANNSLTQSCSRGFLSMMSYHRHMMMHFLHGFCAQLPLWHIDS
jgi:hypothetical protein